MKIGVPKEVKNRELRVGVTPSGARELVAEGHQVFVETMAGAAIGFTDAHYTEVGCEILPDAESVFLSAELLVKVKEPQPQEIKRLNQNQTLFTYLHLASDPEQTRGLMETGATCIAYETITDLNGRLPLLAPMSEVAGRLSVTAGARHLETLSGNIGLLLGGVTGVAPAKVLVVGGGVAGTNAAQMAIGLGAEVTILDRSIDRLRQLGELFSGRAKALFSTTSALESELACADLVIGAVLLPGAAAPKIITREHLKLMKPGAVIVDIAIDQGGCCETSRPTSHDDPVYVVDDIVHYCVTNMPAAVARTATIALTNATLPFVKELAGKGPATAMADNPHLAAGLNIQTGRITNTEVLKSIGDLV